MKRLAATLRLIAALALLAMMALRFAGVLGRELVGGFLFALLRGRLDFQMLRHVLADSARTSAMLFALLIGATIFANFVDFTTLPQDLEGFVTEFRIHPLAVNAAICLVYIVLGTAMGSLS